MAQVLAELVRLRCEPEAELAAQIERNVARLFALPMNLMRGWARKSAGVLGRRAWHSALTPMDGMERVMSELQPVALRALQLMIDQPQR